MTKRIHITFNKLGEGQMECRGYKTFKCLGKKGLEYPKDLMIDLKKQGIKVNPYFSKEYVCPVNKIELPCRMNFSILIWGQKGVYIHEWPNPATYIGNGGATGGCIHLEIGDAKRVYDWVDQNTRVTMDYHW